METSLLFIVVLFTLFWQKFNENGQHVLIIEAYVFILI